MNKSLQVGLGAFLILIGLVWMLQGLGVLPGKLMSGVTLWAIVGPIVAIIGAFMVFRAVRARP